MEKKKLNTLTKGMALAGVLVILSSIVWHIVHPDTSQLGITILQGVFILGFAYICEFTRRMQEKYDELDNRIDAMDLWMKEELNKCSKK